MATPMAEDSSFEDDQLASMTTEDIIRGSRLVDNEIRILKVWYFSLYLSPCEDNDNNNNNVWFDCFLLWF